MLLLLLLVLVQGVNLGREDVVKPAYSKDVSSAETLSASPAPFSKVCSGTVL